MTPDERKNYILMERIISKPHTAIMIKRRECLVYPAVSELGIYSCFLADDDKLLENTSAGYLVRTKVRYKQLTKVTPPIHPPTFRETSTTREEWTQDTLWLMDWWLPRNTQHEEGEVVAAKTKGWLQTKVNQDRSEASALVNHLHACLVISQ